MRLSNKYDFKPLNDSGQNSEPFSDDRAADLEDTESPATCQVEEGRPEELEHEAGVRQLGAQQSNSDGKLEELNRNVCHFISYLDNSLYLQVLLSKLVLAGRVWWLLVILMIFFLFSLLQCLTSPDGCEGPQSSAPVSCALDGYVELSRL